MKNMQNDHVQENGPAMLDRRKFLIAGAGVVAASLLPHVSAAAQVQEGHHSHQGTGAGSPQQPSNLENRRLGALEVSSIGLGVQNMSRKYETTVPYRPEMISVIRAAFDRGVTFFDAAEAYGPFEVERILGEGVAPFRNKVVIATKFGWNIEQETGKRLPGLNSKPEHIKLVVEAMLKRLRTDHIDLLYQHRVDSQVPIEDVAGAVKELMAQGKVLHWGLSEMGVQTLFIIAAIAEAQPMDKNQALSAKQQGIIPIAAFTAKGDLEKLKVSLNEGLDASLTVNEIKEILVQLHAYTGFPRSLNAIGTFMGVMEERQKKGIKDEIGRDASPLPAKKSSVELGTDIQSKLVGKPVTGAIYTFAPAINQFLKGHLFGDIFGRDNLDFQSREIATISALASMDDVNPQLQAHFNVVLNTGLTEAQLKSLISVLSARVGKKEADNASEIFGKVLSDRKSK